MPWYKIIIAIPIIILGAYTRGKLFEQIKKTSSTTAEKKSKSKSYK